MAWRKDTVYDIPIDDIKEITIDTVGVVKKSAIKYLITQVCLNIKTEKGDYVLRTLYVKGLGLKKILLTLSMQKNVLKKSVTMFTA